MEKMTLQEPAREIDVIHKTEVLVVGSGPGGLPAALAAARTGAQVTLVERFGCFGGNLTVVGVEGMHWYRHEQTVESNGIAREFEEMSKEMGAAVPESQSLSYEIDSEGFKIAASSKRFLHLEQSYEVRRDQRDIMLNHLKSAWADYAASPDFVPDSFSFNEMTNAAIDTEQVSSPQIISGFNRSIAISIIDGEYSINNAEFTSATGTINSGDSIVVRHTSSNSSAAQKITTLNIGGFSKVFSSMTVAEQTTTSDASNSSGGGSLPINILILLSMLLGLNHLTRRRHFTSHILNISGAFHPAAPTLFVYHSP